MVWTPVYMDEAGKGRMITLSSPLYCRSEFMGAVSLDFTTGELGKMLGSVYDGYVLDSAYTVIASNGSGGDEDGISSLAQQMGIRKNTMDKIEAIESGTVVKAGSWFVYKADFEETPLMLLYSVPARQVYAWGFLFTIPILVVFLLLVIAFREIRNRREAEETIRRLSTIDPLTGLRNRLFLEATMEKEIERTNDSDSVIMMDLDHFKKINDIFGHPVGDDVLKKTAKIIMDNLRDADIPARLGGEEFLIFLPGMGLEDAVDTAENIRKALDESPHPVAGRYSASFGVAQRKPNESVLSLYDRVDEALYMAKRRGRNRVEAFGTEDRISVAFAHVKWNREWESGHEKIDEQHRHLVKLGNDLITLSFSNADQTEVSSKLDEMIEHIVLHFEYEEEIQKEAGFAGCLEHKEIHEDLTSKAEDIRESYKKGMLKSSEIFSFLLDEVVVGHMAEEDVKFYAYL